MQANFSPLIQPIDPDGQFKTWIDNPDRQPLLCSISLYPQSTPEFFDFLRAKGVSPHYIIDRDQVTQLVNPDQQAYALGYSMFGHFNSTPSLITGKPTLNPLAIAISIHYSVDMIQETEALNKLITYLNDRYQTNLPVYNYSTLTAVRVLEYNQIQLKDLFERITTDYHKVHELSHLHHPNINNNLSLNHYPLQDVLKHLGNFGFVLPKENQFDIAKFYVLNFALQQCDTEPSQALVNAIILQQPDHNIIDMPEAWYDALSQYNE
jgi:hypothetical protein